MIVKHVAHALNLQVVAGAQALERDITGGYCADLLSCVMARAKAGNVWVTLQAHPNVLAVAVLLELAAVIVTEGAPIPDEVKTRADAEGIALLATPHTTFWVVSELARLGIPAQE
ncbi:MAG: DRTGG domain-containing protein [Anaerolineae bacterium]|nr:DRTGG domain-containing protein [Anaerolineae bacterium]